MNQEPVKKEEEENETEFKINLQPEGPCDEEQQSEGLVTKEEQDETVSTVDVHSEEEPNDEEVKGIEYPREDDVVSKTSDTLQTDDTFQGYHDVNYTSVMYGEELYDETIQITFEKEEEPEYMDEPVPNDSVIGFEERWEVGEITAAEMFEEEEGEIPEYPPSTSTSARRSEIDSIGPLERKLSPFYMIWCFGMKKTVPIINLSNSEKHEIFFVSSHLGIVYDYKCDRMKFLPGHQNSITAISADETGRWLTTADVGEDHIIIVWDNDLTLPIWTLYNPFPNEGTRCCTISPNGKYLAATNYGEKPTLHFWVWTKGLDEPDATLDLNPKHGTVKQIVFNPNINEQIIVTMENKIIFIDWSEESQTLKFFEPDIKAKGKIGTFTESLYLEDNHTVVSATSRGQLIVWCDVSIEESIREELPISNDKEYSKIVRVQRDYITTLRLVDSTIVTSALNGMICFHDQSLKLLYWIPKFQLDPIVCISFHLIPRQPEQFDPFGKNKVEITTKNSEESHESEYLKTKTVNLSRHSLKEAEEKNFKFEVTKLNKPLRLPSDCSLERKPFSVRDFIFTTTTGKIGYISPARSKLKYFLYHSEAPILSLDTSPNKAHFVTGNQMGRLSLFNYRKRDLLLTRTVSNCGITCLKYNPSGNILAAGLSRGDILIIDPYVLEIKFTYEHARSDINNIRFSDDGKFLVHTDLNMAVCLYIEKEDHSWIFLGKYISHYKPIRDIIFESNPLHPAAPRLFSIGEDRILVEYDTQNLREEKLELKYLDRIEQTAVPLCFVWQPKFYKDTNLIISNNEFKLKVLDINDKTCKKTTLGPTADEPIKLMKIIPDVDIDKKKGFMLYTTKKYIGLKKIPPTGNPFEQVGMIGHSEEVIMTALSYNSKYVFTIGRNDCSVTMWKVNTSAVEIAEQLGGEDLNPFISLIQGGANGFLFHEMEDFFYYAQIMHQGEYANLDRSISKYVALCEIPDLLRSLGYYPSEYEVENIKYELSHRNFEETGELDENINFDDFVKVYLNHRPVHGVSMESIANAFTTIADRSENGSLVVTREDLFLALEDRAENMSHEEIVGYLSILLLHQDETEPFPESMPLDRFADECLGIDLSITEDNVIDITHGTTEATSLN